MSLEKYENRRLMLLPWWGGKSYLLDKIYPFPKHKVYVDVFGGSGAVLLNKPVSEMEVYNDLNNNIYNLFVVLKDNLDEFIEKFRILGCTDSRAIFDYFKQKLSMNNNLNNHEELTPIQQAMAYYYVQRHSFGGKGEHYVSQHIKQDNPNTKIRMTRKLNEPKVREIAKRVHNVIFENLPFDKLFTRVYMDREDTMIYLDPPYLVGGDHYEKMQGGNEWNHDQINTMCDLVRDNNSFVCISYDTDLSEELQGSKWIRKKIERLNARAIDMGDGKRQRTKGYEYVITNYDINEVPHQIDKRHRQLSDFF